MSILSKLISDLSAVIFPPKCIICQEPIHISESLICTKCFGSISYTRFWEYSDNAMAQHARDLQPFIHHASAMLFYDSYSRDMIHRLKYRGEWHTAKYLGKIFGGYLMCSELYEDVDMVVPVPLHPLRRIVRGYNQAEYIASGIAAQMGCAKSFGNLYRTRYTSAQARKDKVDRWKVERGLFEVRNPKILNGKHILLVDDVYTTGATIFRCAEALHLAAPEARISIIAVAASREYGI